MHCNEKNRVLVVRVPTKAQRSFSCVKFAKLNSFVNSIYYIIKERPDMVKKSSQTALIF